MPRVLLVVAALTAAPLAACNAYDPKLGYEPFQCGDTEPRCPLDYTCVTFTSGEAICQLTGAEIPDAGDVVDEFTCYDDSVIEPNDQMAQALDTQIPASQTAFSAVGLSICPSNDEDFFSFQVLGEGVGVTVDVVYRPDQGQLLVDLLNAGGQSIASAAPVDAAPNTLHLQVADLAVGKHYVQVHSADGVENNYESIDIATTGQ